MNISKQAQIHKKGEKKENKAAADSWLSERTELTPLGAHDDPHGDKMACFLTEPSRLATAARSHAAARSLINQ